MRRSSFGGVAACAGVVGLVALVAASAGTAAEAQDEPAATEQVLLVIEGDRPAPEVAAATARSAEGAVVDTEVADQLAIVEVPVAEVSRLAEAAGVAGIVRRSTGLRPALDRSVPEVGAPTQWSAGFDGAGEVVVMIDTGVDATNPAVGGTKLIGEACFARQNCRTPTGEIVDSAIGPGTATPCSRLDEVPPECLHGTLTAATAVGTDPLLPGVAPGASLYAIQVVDPDASFAFDLDVLNALGHVVDLVDAGTDVAAVNLSLGGGLFSGSCDDHVEQGQAIGPAYRLAIDALVSRGVPVVASSGNDRASTGPGSIALPACISSAIATGATELDDDVAVFSNASPSLDLLAPGDGFTPFSGLQMPGVAGSHQGTSFAAPHVAGALALLGQEYPKASVEQLRLYLARNGVSVFDAGVGRAFPRLRLRPQDLALPAGFLFPGYAGFAGGPLAALGDYDGDSRVDVISHGPGPLPDRIGYGTPLWDLEIDAVPDVSVAGSYLPLAGQFDGEQTGPDDILWYAAGPDADGLWTGRPDRSFGKAALTISGTYEPIVGDFDGDGWDDVFWYAAGPAGDYLSWGGESGLTWTVPESTARIASRRVTLTATGATTSSSTRPGLPRMAFGEAVRTEPSPPAGWRSTRTTS